MFRHDPDRYRRVYKAAHDATKAIATADRAEQCRQFDRLTEQYPFYTDFDSIACRDYVLYADALSGEGYDCVERYYTDIIIFQALQSALDEAWPRSNATSDKELKHLDSYLLRFKDTLFKARMEDALREFYAYRRGKGNNYDQDVYETSLFTVQPVYHFAENRYGIHFKEADEFGLYGFFIPDNFDPDASDKIFENFYRSNDGFTKEIILKDLGIKAPF